MIDIRTTEQESKYNNLENLSFSEIVLGMNAEDLTVPKAIQMKIEAIAELAEAIYKKMSLGGRLFYIGSGTSGRLGVIDASECPPTFGVAFDRVIGIIAGGDSAIRKAVEFAEDDTQQAWIDLQKFEITTFDFVVGITASGSTPYVIGGLKMCQENGIKTGSISCNANSSCSVVADFPVEIVVGPEYITGSTRLKAGTAQKLVLNMLTTSVMIKLGHIKGNKMVDMQLSNHKLIERGTRFIMEATGIPSEKANALLKEAGSVRKAIELYNAQH